MGRNLQDARHVSNSGEDHTLTCGPNTEVLKWEVSKSWLPAATQRDDMVRGSNAQLQTMIDEQWENVSAVTEYVRPVL